MKNKNQNYLDKIPKRKETVAWHMSETNEVILEIENKGLFNRIAQKIFKKPKISYIHLEEFGSFIWNIIDGETDITSIGKSVKEHFGDKAEPIYPRLAQYFQTLENYGFITF